MRIALITLAVAALAFIGSIIYTILPENIGTLENKGTITIEKQQESLTSVDIEIIKSLAKIQDDIKTLKEQQAAGSTKTVQSPFVTENTSVAATSSTGSTEVKAPEVKVSGKLLSKIMPTVDLKLEANKGIYDLLAFESVPYSTYFDSKLGLRVMAIDISYDAFLKNIKTVVRDVYSINETKTFPFASFYVNSIKPDTLIRLVVSFENQTVALEIPKTKFPILKALLLKK